PATLTLTDDDDLTPDTGQDVLTRAQALLDQGTRAEVTTLCLQTLAQTRLPVVTAANLVLALRRAEAPEVDQIEADLLTQLRARVTAKPDDPRPRINLGRLLYGLDRFDEAATVLTAALPRDPLNLRAVMTLTAILLKQGNPDAATALWHPAFHAEPSNGKLPLDLARILAYAGHLDHARQMLDRAEPLCRDNRHEFEFVADAIRGTKAATSQAAMTVELFDRFAQSYDANLAALGNRGPQMVAEILDALNLPKSRKLNILDAGCGTGLCAHLLRPYAKTLHGVDLSPGMLAQSKKKKLYNHLTRSDLASIGTLPPGPFDMIASSDVLVYFGDLAPVLSNFAKILKPGGWLILTLELTDHPRGWTLNPSGRHKHDPAYLKSALQTAGFTAPKTRIDGDLRHEFAQPVRGFAIAAQRLALAFTPQR
ncbi:MAG: methyltransferase domain-containing protein, partial [Paracoccaceae bacterium]